MDGNISKCGYTTTVVLSLTRKRQASSPADVECSSSSIECSDSSKDHKRRRDLSAELPFILMDIKPDEEAPRSAPDPAPHHDHDHIQVNSHPDDNGQEHADDQILDDLARLRLKGAADSDP